jgi:cellulose synthase/poly-beta-1,6-N-acetylglucosamine synthase-like glycosyltransferase
MNKTKQKSRYSSEIIYKKKISLVDRFIILLVFIFIYIFVYIFSNSNYQLIFSAILFILFLYTSVLLLLLHFKYKHTHSKERFPNKVPTVAVVTYAFNGFRAVEQTVKKLCKLEYPIPYNVYVINDGTVDFLKKYKKVKLINLSKSNFTKGQNIKATIMNIAFKKLKEENILCTDGDTLVEKNVLMNMTGLLDNKTAAVIGFVRPYNHKNIIERLQIFEYNLYFGLWNRGLAIMDSVFVVVGPLNLINRKKFLEVGGFDVTNITEDTDLAFLFRKKGYKIKHTINAIAETEVPSNLKSYIKQRVRWYRGGYLTWLKHKKMFFSKNGDIFGNFILPYFIFVNILGMGALLQIIWNVIRTYIVQIFYYILECAKQGVFYIDLNIKFIYVPPTTILLLFTLIIALFLAIIAFSFSDYKLKTKDIPIFILFTFGYGLMISVIYLYSLFLEFIGKSYKW